MFEDTRKFFVEAVLPSYREYMEHLKSNAWGESQLLRKGINAAISLCHLREHLPSQLQRSRSELVQHCTDYGLICDITNVAKHQTITRYVPKLSSAGQIFERLTTTYYLDEHGEYTAPQLEVCLKLDDE
jgi:hypothetical protein